MSGTALTIRPEWLNPFTLSVILADLDAHHPEGDADIDGLWDALFEELTRRTGEGWEDYFIEAAEAACTYGAVLLQMWLEESRRQNAVLAQGSA